MTIFDSRPSNHFNNILYNIRLDAMFAKRILIEPETTELAQRFYKKIKKIIRTIPQEEKKYTQAPT